MDYADFGHAFFVHAVTAERIAAGFKPLGGDPIAFGPIGAGPGKMARVTAEGIVGEPSVQAMEGEEVSFRLTIPVALDLEIDLGVDRHRYHVEVKVGLTLVARAAPPLRVVVDIDAPTWRDVDVDLEAHGVRASLLQRVAGIDREIARFVARYVARELDKPHIRSARDIDVAARIDSAYAPNVDQ